MTPAQLRAALARIDADLAAARLRREGLEYSWAVSSYTASGTRDPAELEVSLAQVNAELAELEARRETLTTPGDAPALAPPAAAPPPQAEYLTAKQAAALLGTTVKGLEGMRRRGTGPAFVPHGKRVRYRRADLLAPPVQKPVQGKPSKRGDGT